MQAGLFPDIGQIVDEKMAQLWAAIGDKWSNLWAPISDAWPLWWSYGVLALIVAACLFLAIFLQFKWVRLGLLLIIVAALCWVSGRHTMYNAMLEKVKAERAKRKR